MEITKVKYDGARVSIRHEEGNDCRTLESTDPPEPELAEALQSLRGEVIRLCDLPTSWLDKATVRGVTWAEGAEGEEQVTVCMLVELSWTPTPMVINTPLVGGDNISEKMDVALRHVKERAERYVNGDRAQMQIPEAA